MNVLYNDASLLDLTVYSVEHVTNFSTRFPLWWINTRGSALIQTLQWPGYVYLPCRDTIESLQYFPSPIGTASGDSVHVRLYSIISVRVVPSAYRGRWKQVVLYPGCPLRFVGYRKIVTVVKTYWYSIRWKELVWYIVYCINK